MKWATGIALATGLVLIICLAVASKFGKGGEPSLGETLAWMESTYNPHQSEGGGWGHGRLDNANDGKSFRRKSETLATKGCKMTLTVRDEPLANSQLLSTFTTTFDLGDIDPRAISMIKYDSMHGGHGCKSDPNYFVCDMAQMDFETRNQKPLMQEQLHTVYPNLQGKEHENSRTYKTFVASIELDEIDYADRFEKAFRHAISLCGGKLSTF